MDTISVTDAPASDTVMDAIAGIEMKRQEIAKKAGFKMARSSALHRLNELFAYETEALRLRGPKSGHGVNIKAVAMEIRRVKALRRATSRLLAQKNGYRNEPEGLQIDTVPSTGQSRGRRTVGRGGGR